jgi:hypothetical protein
MSFDNAIPVADAVLYEGYVLYPYRASSVKNRQRWTFGGVFPRDSSAARTGGDPSSVHFECLLRASADTDLNVRVRFLHLMDRQIARLGTEATEPPMNADERGWAMGQSTFSPATSIDVSASGPSTSQGPADADAFTPPRVDADAVAVALKNARLQFVESLTIAGRTYRPWQEATERDVSIDHMSVGGIAPEPRRVPFAFPSSRTIEPLRNERGAVDGAIVRTQRAISGAIDIHMEPVADGLFRIRVRIENIGDVGNDSPPRTTLAGPAQRRGAAADSEEPAMRLSQLSEPDGAGAGGRDAEALLALVATHAMLVAERGAFVSLTDPPEELRDAANACEQGGLWPVLAGEPGSHDTVLASPIILYDYPEIAAESPGDLFDGTEIDEILTLRILTLTDDEKRELRETDERARALLDRVERLTPEQLMKLHGVLRQPRATPIRPAISGWEQEWDAAFLPLPGSSPGWSERPVDQIRVGGITLTSGTRVRLRPNRRADALDMLLAGRLATIESIQQDVDGQVYLAVTVDDDPGRDLGDARQPGHRFFYGIDEVEPVERLSA